MGEKSHDVRLAEKRQCFAHFTHFAHTCLHIWHTWGNFARQVHPLCEHILHVLQTPGHTSATFGSADSMYVKFCTPLFFHFFFFSKILSCCHQETCLSRYLLSFGGLAENERDSPRQAEERQRKVGLKTLFYAKQIIFSSPHFIRLTRIESGSDT